MKKRLFVAVLAGGTLLAMAPAAYASILPSSSACVVVNGPSGATVQVGYAPNGPQGCTQL
jgi:hypothetical protein